MKRFLAALLLLFFSAPAFAQSNISVSGDVWNALQFCPPATSDGLYHFKTSACPISADAPGGVNNPIVGQGPGLGAPDIPTTDHNVMNDLAPAGIPGSAAPDVLGAFRFVCGYTVNRYDDHVAFYGKPGASHLHSETGPLNWNAFSNYGNLRTAGGSKCNDVAGADKNLAEATWSANRTPYEQPALLDGRGNVINPDAVVFYYKRFPDGSPFLDPTSYKFQGKGARLPNGIKFLFGNHPDDPSLAFDSANIKFMCTGAGTANGEFGSNMLAALQACRGTAGQFEARAVAPGCWDGANLDTADHRSHLAYPVRNVNTGQLRCDAGHPFVIAGFTYAAQYTIAATDDPATIRFSSDAGAPAKPAGWSFHVDYGPMAWDPKVAAMWQDNCINKLLNCSGGNLGNGYKLKGAAQPIYLLNGVPTPLWRNPQRLTPVPMAGMVM
jgi:hypothetical protein